MMHKQERRGSPDGKDLSMDAKSDSPNDTELATFHEGL